MAIRLSILVVIAVTLAGCGGSGGQSTTTTVAAETTIRTFFYRDAALVPTSVRVPQSGAPARAALEALLAGPPADYETALPVGVELESVAIDDGIAVANFSSALGEPHRTAQAQIVATLMQFPSVRGVEIQADGMQAPLENGAGDQLSGPATNADYGDLTAEAPIFVSTPTRDSTVSSPVHAAGTANVFEATIHVEVWSGDKLVETQLITATSGSGTRGTWEATLPLPNGDVRLVFFEPSAEDGSHLHQTEVLLHVR